MSKVASIFSCLPIALFHPSKDESLHDTTMTYIDPLQKKKKKKKKKSKQK